MNRLRTLDGLRGVAIAMVVAGHAATHYQPLDSTLRELLTSFANAGLGVRIFFALSGYLITHLLLEEIANHGRADLQAFWKRRAVRILPAFAVYMGALAAWGSLHPTGWSWPHWTSAATFTWNYVQPLLPANNADVWVLGHTWSLAVEAQFYLLWPLVLLRLGARKALVVVLVLFALEPALRVGSYMLFPATRGYLVMMLHTGADALIAGCAAALLCRRERFLGAMRQHGNTVATLALLWIFVASPLTGYHPPFRGFSLVLGITLDALAAASLVVWLHHAAPASARRVFGSGPLPWLGLVSYSLYLWQQVFLHPDAGLAQGRLVIPLLGAVGIATLSFLWVERPFLSRRAHAPAASFPVSPS